MPSVKVCFWNIKNYGGGDTDFLYGTNSNLRNRFIRDFVRSQEIDVLLIMEVSSNAQASLHNLGDWLNKNLQGGNRDWALSFCGSAIASNAPDPIRGAGDVQFTSDARSEGYGVAWRTNRTARFSMLPGLIDIAEDTWSAQTNPNRPATTPLNFVTTGRPADLVVIDYGNANNGKRKRQDEEFRPLGGYTTGQIYPYDEDGNVMDHWSDLDMPTTSTRNPRTLHRTGTRRPTYVVIELNNQGTTRQRLCPLVVYHAPSNEGQASWGAFMTGLSRELYVTNDLDDNGVPDPEELVHTNHVVMGGDYNFSVDTVNWPSDYRFYINNFNKLWTGGAKTAPVPPSTAPDADRRTTVQILSGPRDNKVPVTSNQVDDYLFHKIDLAFMRPDGTITGSRVNMLQELINDNAGTYRAALKAFHAEMNLIVQSLNNRLDRRLVANGDGPEWLIWDDQARNYVWKPMITGAWGGTFRNWTTFMNRLNAGRFTAPRQAAEFFHIYISDHLPLVVDIPV